jgi:ABC-2 type transport system ATP-binding protein
MDPHSAKLVRDAITELKSDRRAIIVCTHNLAEAEQLAERIAIINRGRIVAEGNPAELKRQLLGRPQLEVQVDRPLNGQMKELEDLIMIEWVAGDVIRFRTDNPVTINPQLVNRLTGLGLGVISLREIGQSLEDVYLHVVSGSATETAGRE